MATLTARPAAAGSPPLTTATVVAARATAIVPSRSMTRRCRAIRPATTADNPRSAARLNTLEPMATPAPILALWAIRALTAAVISGASPASAARRPSRASGRPRRAPIRSSRETTTQLVARLMALAAKKTRIRSGSDRAPKFACLTAGKDRYVTEKPPTGFPEPPGRDPEDRSADPEPHHVLNNPAGTPDPTEWPDPYERRPDPRDPAGG